MSAGEQQGGGDAPGEEKADGLAGMLNGLLAELDGKNLDIDENGRKVKVVNGEIHVIENGKEIFIGRNGIRIRKLPKDAEQPGK